MLLANGFIKRYRAWVQTYTKALVRGVLSVRAVAAAGIPARLFLDLLGPDSARRAQRGSLSGLHDLCEANGCVWLGGLVAGG